MKVKLFTFILFIAGNTFGQSPLWMRYPAISPDGAQIAFNYKGCLLYTSPSPRD